MIDIFLKEDAIKLLARKTIVFLGDSNIRAIYKDFLCLMQKTQFIPDRTLKTKMESSVLGDRLVFHGPKSNGRDYREERVCKIHDTSLMFYFITRVYDDYVREILKHMTSKKPDIIVINSCLWDVTRWGFSGVEKYKENLKCLMSHLKRILPDCLVIWVTAPPISCELKGGFLVQELQFLKYSLRFHVVEANHYARKVVVESGFDVLDSHYHLKMQMHRRKEDGIHWDPSAVRYVSNLLLTHISLAWDFPLPHRYNSSVMDENLQSVIEDETIAEPPIKVEKKTLCSVITRPEMPVKTNEARNEKENCATPKRKQQRVHKDRKRVHQKTSHHAFLSREQWATRHKRVRQWHRAPPLSPHPVMSPYASPASHYGSPVGYINSPAPVVYDQQQDSGYFPSPSLASAHNSHASSPCLSQTNSGYGYHRRRSLLQDPYVFPRAIPGHSLQPRIDFTSDEFPGFV